MSKPEVITALFEREHGRKPKGRGGWLFAIGADPFGFRHEGEFGYGGGLTFAEARKVAVEQNPDARYIVVLP